MESEPEMKTPELTAQIIQEMARLAGLKITLERAEELLPALEPIFQGDAELVRLRLGALSPVGSTWPEAEHG